MEAFLHKIKIRVCLDFDVITPLIEHKSCDELSQIYAFIKRKFPRLTYLRFT